MLKVFTIKYEDKLESFNDALLANFLADKEVIRWNSHFFARKNDYFWTVIVEYKMICTSSPAIPGKIETKRDERYKEILTENDWPLFNRLREWRGEVSKKEGVPPYIIFTNIQLAKIAVTQPGSLNALQEIEGVGNAKREKYGAVIIKIIESFRLPLKTQNGESKNG